MILSETEIAQLNQEFETADPKSILRWAAQAFGDQLAIVTSFQPTGIVTLHMLHELKARPPVLTLDTGLLFPETYALIDDVEARFNLRLHRIRPELTLWHQESFYGPALWDRDPDACCNMRKVVPLDKALAGYDAWVTGLRRDQPGRAKTPIITWERKRGKVKLSPLANWDESMIWTYIHAHELPYNTLHDQGYPSIGCTVCTQPVNEGQDSRAGRWVNHNKTECGIHITSLTQLMEVSHG